MRDYAVVTAAYWVFTLTDGALRMLVLFTLHRLGYTPVAIASLFLFYEFFGIVTNLVGGWVGARFGLKSTLFAGLALQALALGLVGVDPTWITVPTMMVSQAASGVAKDLTKMSSKSYVKLLVPAGDPRGLMRWVALLTGSKNALKGAGFFLGSLLLGLVGFTDAVRGMAAAIVLALLASAWLLPRAAGKAAARPTLASLFPHDPRIRWLSAARLFLFGSRDVWFVVALPIYFASVLGWDFHEAGGFLALWVIGYGIVQASAPALVGFARPTARSTPTAGTLATLTALLLVPLSAILLALETGLAPATTLVLGLGLFGVAFALNSAVHSYLIVAFAEGDRIALRVGFYYMANAMGRLLGTVLSGVLFQAAGQGTRGLGAAIGASIALVLLSLACGGPLRRAERGHDRRAVAGA